MENKTNISDAINEIILKRGISVLNDQAVFCAILDDIAPLASLERNIVHRCLDKETAANLIAVYNGNHDQQIHIFNIINEYLKDSLGVSREWRMIFLKSFAVAFSCEYEFSSKMENETKTSVLNNANISEEKEQVNNIIDFNRYIPGIIGVGASHIIGLKSDGTVVAAGDNSLGQCNVSSWKNIIAVSARSNQTVALLSDGTVVETGARYANADVSMVHNWKDMIGISCGDNHIIALRKNGKPFGCGANQKGQCDVLPWNNITDIAAGYYHTLGLKKNGTVVAIGDNKHGECNVSEWSNIRAIAVGPTHSVGVRADGTVVATGKNDYGECNVEDWNQIIAVKACQRYTMGLKSDGTVILTGENIEDQYDVSNWNDIVSIGIYFKPAGWGDIKVTIVGVQSNGQVKVAGDTDSGQDGASNWNLFHSSNLNKINRFLETKNSSDFSFATRTNESIKESDSSSNIIPTAKGILNNLNKKSFEEKLSKLQKKFWNPK